VSMCHDPLYRLGCRYSGSWHVPRPAEICRAPALAAYAPAGVHGRVLEIPLPEVLPWARSRSEETLRHWESGSRDGAVPKVQQPVLRLPGGNTGTARAVGEAGDLPDRDAQVGAMKSRSRTSPTPWATSHPRHRDRPPACHCPPSEAAQTIMLTGPWLDRRAGSR
jgi:hypothetical protein